MNIGFDRRGRRYWTTRFRKWPRPAGSLAEGYSLLVPVPGDLPAFLDLALTVCAAQRSDHRRETIVIPDRMTAGVRDIMRRHGEGWSGPLRLQVLPRPERWLLPLLRSGSRNHAVQLIAGTAAATSRHVVLHDADLFPCTPDLIESQYREATTRGVACYGLTGVWDPWYAQHGLRLAATWDIVASVEWLRSFPPHQHMGHDDELFGERHTFDTTLQPQALSDPATIDHGELGDAFVHFNYVISAYRLFQRHGPGYTDDRFVILLVSLVEEALGAGAGRGGLPGPAALASCLGRSDGVLRFPAPDEASERYVEFRRKVDRVLAGGWVAPDRAAGTLDALGSFDRYYGLSS